MEYILTIIRSATGESAGEMPLQPAMSPEDRALEAAKQCIAHAGIYTYLVTKRGTLAEILRHTHSLT